MSLRDTLHRHGQRVVTAGTTVAQPQTPQDEGGSSKVVLIVMIFMILAVVAVGIFTGVSISSANARLDKAREANAAIHEDIAEAKKKRKAAEEKSASEATGLDVKRQQRDDAVAEKLFSTASTWKDMNEYISKRKSVQKSYGFGENSYFMRTFMPGEKQGAWSVDKKGTMYFPYPKANSQFVEMKSTVTKVEGNTWSYLTRVTVRSITSSHHGEAERTMIATYSVDKSEKLSNMKIFTSPAAVGTSQ